MNDSADIANNTTVGKIFTASEDMSVWIYLSLQIHNSSGHISSTAAVYNSNGTVKKQLINVSDYHGNPDTGVSIGLSKGDYIYIGYTTYTYDDPDWPNYIWLYNIYYASQST